MGPHAHPGDGHEVALGHVARALDRGPGQWGPWLQQRSQRREPRKRPDVPRPAAGLSGGCTMNILVVLYGNASCSMMGWLPLVRFIVLSEPAGCGVKGACSM